MELEEMQAAWQVLSQKVDQQEKLTTQMIEKVTQQNFKTKLNDVAKWEYAGTLICYIALAYLAVNFSKINQTYVQVFAVICMAILLILPIISLKSIKGMNKLNIATGTYADTVKTYVEQKVRFQRLQKLNVLFTIILMAIAMPVLMAIKGIDLGKVHYYWSVMFPVMILFFLIFAWWVLRYYDRTLDKAESILAEMES